MRAYLTAAINAGIFCFAISAHAQTTGESLLGQSRYLSLCASCHGVPPDHRAMQAANNPDTLSQALNSVSGMGFLRALLLPKDIIDIARYLGDTSLSQVTTAVVKRGAGAGVVTSEPSGISCGAVCVWNFLPGADVNLTAVAARGSTFVGWSVVCQGQGVCRVQTGTTQTAFAEFSRNGPTADYSGLWWAGPAEKGWGMSITHRAGSGQLFSALHVYDEQGEPTWYVMPAGEWRDEFAAFHGALFRPTGAALDQYAADQLNNGEPVGEATIRFLAPDQLELTVQINARGGVIQLPKLSIASAGARAAFGVAESLPRTCRVCRDNRAPAPLAVGDLWRGGPRENGWFVSLTQQGASVVGIWYTFDRSGRPTWFVMPGGGWLDRRYAGPLYRTSSAAWAPGQYDAGRLIATLVGELVMEFGGDSAAQMSYRFDGGTYRGVIQTKAVMLLPF